MRATPSVGIPDPFRSSGDDSRPIRHVATGALLFALGTALGVLLAALPIRARVPLGISFRDLLRLPGIGSLTWYACLISSPLFVWLSRRFPIYGPHWRRHLVWHVLTTTTLVCLTAVIYFQLLIGD